MDEIRHTEVRCLIHLLACALNGRKPEVPEGIDYASLLYLAKKHQVYNIIFPLVSSLENVPDEEKARFRDYSMSELKRMLVMNSEREAVYKALTKQGIRFMPLKGLIIKAYYPKESMRQMSDNDILFDAENRDAVRDIMKQRGYKTVATGENSDDYHKEPFSTFEFHRTLFFKENEFHPSFDGIWENALPDSENPCLYHMGLEDVYIYSVCHMYKHYISAGCGIRFLADNYLILKRDGERLDKEFVKAQLEEYGILDFEEKTRLLAFKLFDEKPLTEEDEKLLEVFINFGIFGSGTVRLGKTLESMSDGGSVESAKKKYIMQRLFPPKKKMIADYRALEKRPYLLPAYYVYRLFKGTVHSGDTLSEVKSIKNIKD